MSVNSSLTILIVIVVLAVLFICCYCAGCCVCKRRRRSNIDYLVYKQNNFPNTRREKLKISRYSSNTIKGCLFLLKSCAAWIRIHCPCSFSFTDMISLKEAIYRYQENPPESKGIFIKNLKENIYVHIILSYINQKLPKFYFKILPSGSLREGFGSKLPSTSILATDYDLMLVPDGIYVYDRESKHSDEFPATFIAIDNPNENPNTPKGFLWLLFKQYELKAWKKLCYERLMHGGVEMMLSQLAVLNMIQQVIGNSSFLTALKLMACPLDTATLKNQQAIGKSSFRTALRLVACRLDTETLEYSVEAFRSGPALTIIIKKQQPGIVETNNEETKEIFHADFTIAISCPVFPQCAKDFFERRTKATYGQIYWPTDGIVQKIETLGCHVVPKPSQKELVQFKTEEESEKSYLNQGAVLEWRYSFSQAEMLLADEIPDKARTAFVAFKAVIKTHVNNMVDRAVHQFHDISSYVLKTILFYEVERTSADFWEEDESECIFFKRLMDVLLKCLENKRCDHFWIPKINLLEDKVHDDFAFFISRLNIIRMNYEKHLVSDWLEFQRCIRLHCCKSCIDEGNNIVQLTGLEKIPCVEDGYRCCVCYACKISHDAESWKCQMQRDNLPPLVDIDCARRFGPIRYNAELFEVY